VSSLNGGVASKNLANARFVRLSVPEFCVGYDFDEMVQFCLKCSEEFGCFTTRANQRDWIVFCFRDPKNAKEFAERFSGEVFEP